MTLTIVRHHDSFEALLKQDPAGRYTNKNHVLQVKINRALEASNVSSELYDKWKNEVNNYWIKVNWCALPTSETGEYDGLVEARPVPAQLGIQNQTLNHLIHRSYQQDATITHMARKHDEMKEEINGLKESNPHLLSTVETLVSTQKSLVASNNSVIPGFNHVSSNLNLVISGIQGISVGASDQHISPGGLTGATGNNAAPVGVPLLTIPTVACPAHHRHQSSSARENKDPKDIDLTFSTAYTNTQDAVSPCNKFMSIFRNRLFALYRPHLASDKWKQIDNRDKKSITTNMELSP